MASLISTNLIDISPEDPIYQQGFATHLSLLTMPDTLDYINENIDKYVSHTTGSFRVLSIGCGDGRFDLDLLEIISQRFPLLNIEYVGLEPNQHRLALFKENISLRSFVSRHYFHLQQTDFDSYENRTTDEKFDLILCIRVLYYMHDCLESTFIQLINRLTAKGKIFVVHKSPSGICQIIHAAGLAKLSPIHVCNTRNLRQALEKVVSQISGVRFSIMYLDNYVDIKCLKHINSNEKSEREKALGLLSFYLGKNLIGVDEKLIEKIVFERILPLVTFQTEENPDSCLMFHPVGIIVIETHSQ